MNILDSLLSVFSIIEPYVDYTTKFNQEIDILINNSYNRILNLSENEVKEINKSTVQSIAYTVRIILSYDTKLMNKYYEEIMLNYHWRCLTSKILEKRIKGITSLNNILDYLEKKERGYDFSSDENEPEEKLVNFNQKTFLLYFKAKGILEEFLGEKIHEEILKRSSPIFKLFTRFNALNKNYFDQLLKIRIELHESFAKQVEIVICDLCSFLNEEDKLYLYSQIIGLNEEKYDLKFLIFLKNFSLNSLSGLHHSLNNTEKQTNLYGIPLFWKVMQDDFKIITKDTNYIDTCVHFVFELLFDSYVSFSVIEEYIKLCIENLKNVNTIYYLE